MPKIFTRVSLLLVLTGAVLAACKKEITAWQPVASPMRSASPSLSELKTWYAGRASAAHARPAGSKITRTAAATSPDSLNWLAIKWEKLDTIATST